MRTFIPLLCLCLLFSMATTAQKKVVYPAVPALRSSLLQLIESKQNAFQDIKGGWKFKKGSAEYYEASLHFMPNDTPRVVEDTDPIKVYYYVFLHQGLTEEESKTVFAEWQKLVAESLPGYTMSPQGTQYPDLENADFMNPNGSIKLTIYRNGTKDKCQVSFAMVNDNINEIRAAVNKYPVKPVTVKPAPKKDSVKTTKKEPVKEPASESQVKMQQTLTRLLNDRLNGFRNFKGGVITTKGTTKYVAKGTDYGYAEDLVEYIEVLSNQVVYTVILSGDSEASESAAAYGQMLSAEQLRQGYKYNTVQEKGTTKTYSISYKGVVISKCIYTNNGDNSETSITISGK